VIFTPISVALQEVAALVLPAVATRTRPHPSLKKFPVATRIRLHPSLKTI
jgi:hypothetical protein